MLDTITLTREPSEPIVTVDFNSGDVVVETRQRLFDDDGKLVSESVQREVYDVADSEAEHPQRDLTLEPQEVQELVATARTPERRAKWKAERERQAALDAAVAEREEAESP